MSKENFLPPPAITTNSSPYQKAEVIYDLKIWDKNSDEAEVRFGFVSPAIDPDFLYNRHHVQFHREFQDVRNGFSLNKLHIPTGEMTMEKVIRFLIADLDVPPLVSNWDEELRKSEERFQVWTGQRETQ